MTNDMRDAQVLLVGCGKMGVDYAQVLSRIGINFTVIGRSVSGVEKFKKLTGKEGIPGGLQSFLSKRVTFTKPFSVIVCVNSAEVVNVVNQLYQAQISGLIQICGMLLEKPLAVEPQQALRVVRQIQDTAIQAYVAFNRRYYPAVRQLKSIIDDEGGVEYVHFEFNEWEERFEKAVLSSLITEYEANNWEFVTGCHVIDMAFFLAGGIPIDVHCISTSGNLPPMTYHTKSSVFGGAASTSTGSLVAWKTYFRHRAPWKVEILTASKTKYELNPIETLFKVDSSNNAEDITVPPPKYYAGLRPGLGEMVEEFISKSCRVEYEASESLMTLSEYEVFLERLYCKICKPSKPSVLMVGGGNIAFRYMQGFLTFTDQPPLIYVSEPSKQQLDTLMSNLHAVDPHVKNSIFCTSTPSRLLLPRRPNLILCATGARHRFSSTLDILSKVDDVDVVLLEKPSFQRLADFDKFFDAAEARALRVYSTAGANLNFSNLLKEVSSWKTAIPDQLITVRVQGAGWGLCCNSCHYFAHFCLVNGLTDGISLGEQGFDLQATFQGLVPSKRAGCQDIASGHIKLIHVASGKVVVDLRCGREAGDSPWHSIQYEADTSSAYYRVGEKAAVVSNGELTTSMRIDVQYTSQAAPKILQEVVSSGKMQSCLTLKAVSTFEKPLLQRFKEHFESCGVDTSDGVPIS